MMGKPGRKAGPLEFNLKERQTIHVALEDTNFIWCQKEVRKFRKLWVKGLSIFDIAQELERPDHEVLILAVDQDLLERIEPRENGIFGTKRGENK